MSNSHAPKPVLTAQQSRALLDLVRTHVAALLGHKNPAAREPGRPFFDHVNPAALAAYLRDELCPDIGGGQVTSVLAGLDRLEVTLAALSAEDIERHKLPGRLQTLTDRLGGGTSSPRVAPGAA
ncbi:acyl carrier protein [Nocardia sp. CNY236]|uniref:acyl carrier protein n=1 Tax=Nocardia sp. CNY236 TaxID=1169152 RepID=UPI0012DE55FF|nr:acyl carrier protein [Nocardia sp. CNY236]